MKSQRIQEVIPCGCGCGTPIKRWVESIRRSTDGTKAWIVKTRERRFVNGHAARTDAHKEVFGRARRGANNVNWKGGISKERDRLKATLEYKAWAFGIYSRDRFLCQLCGVKCKRPEAHHIKPVRDFPALVLEPTNGVTLCGPCHELTYGKEVEFVAHFAACVANGVNSGDARPGDTEGNPEPSREGNLPEGATTRGRGCPIDLERFKKHEVPCETCGVKLLRHPYRMKQPHHYCSIRCASIGKSKTEKGRGSTKVLVRCGFCGAEIFRPPCRVNGSKAQYCGMQCMGRAWADRRWNAGNAPTSAPPEKEEIV